MDLILDDEQRMIRDMVRELVANELSDQAAAIDHQESLDARFFKRLGELGLMAMQVPEEHGGGEIDTLSYVVSLAELARGCAATAFTVNLHNAFGCQPLLSLGSEAQQTEWLPRLAAGGTLATSFLTGRHEEFDGAPALARARRHGGVWTLSADAKPVAAGGRADLLVVPARTGDAEAVTWFLAPTATAGVERGERQHTLGLRGVDWTEVRLNDVKLADTFRLGPEGAGLEALAASFDLAALGTAAVATGLMAQALQAAAAYLTERKQFGRPLARFQGLRHMVAEMATRLAAAEALIEVAARRSSLGQPFGEAAAKAQLYATEVACGVTKDALQLHGGNGYTREYPLERYYRDARVTGLVCGSRTGQRERLATTWLEG